MRNVDYAAYSSWLHMKARCLNKNNDRYYDYGGRGITICERWLRFDNFLEDMGERPEGTSIERIDVEGNYEPSNCAWATAAEQQLNRRVQRNNKLRTRGVDFVARRNEYRARYNHAHLGWFKPLAEAANAVELAWEAWRK